MSRREPSELAASDGAGHGSVFTIPLPRASAGEPDAEP